MLLAAFLAHTISATPAPLGEDTFAVAGAQTSGDLLKTFLADNALLWGCMALALIALVTVGGVASRRRKAGKSNAQARARSNAVHDFLKAVKEPHNGAVQGVWHYDFITGAQQFSEGLETLVGHTLSEESGSRPVGALLTGSGLDLVALAQKNFDQTDPYEVQFVLKTLGDPPRPMVLKACNLRNSKGEVQRLVAIMREAVAPSKGDICEVSPS